MLDSYIIFEFLSSTSQVSTSCVCLVVVPN